MEKDDDYYVILNMNCQYEICHNCPKSGIFKGTYEECEAFIEGIEFSDTPLEDEYKIYANSTPHLFDVKLNDAILYTSKWDKCYAFVKGIEYKLKEETRMEEKSNNLKYENNESPVSPSSIKTNNFETWFPYHSPDEELRNNLKSVIESNMTIDEKLNLIIALCKPTENPYVITVQNPTENTNPYNPPKVWYNYRGDQINPNDVWCNSKPNPYMPYEYCSTQLKSDTENNDLVHVPVGGTIPTELYNIIKDKIKYGIEYHECDGTKINKKEYKFLYNFIGHKYDDVGDNADASDFRLPNAKGWYIRIK